MRLLTLALGMAVLSAASPAVAAETEPLSALLAATGLKYMMQNPSTALLLVRGDSGVNIVVVREVDEVAAVYCEIAEADEARITSALWRKIATVNARATLAHVGYARGKRKLYAICGHPLSSGLSGPLLREMIVQVALMADELRPVFRDLLEVE